MRAITVHASCNPFARVWRAYEGQLQKRPLVMQMATSAVMWAAGDLVSQRVERKNAMDVKRIALTSGFGCSFIAPLGHWWYTMLDVLFSRLGPPGAASVLVAKVLADLFIYSAVCNAAFLMFGSSVIDGKDLSRNSGEVHSKMQSDFITVMMAQTSFWPPAMMIIFSRVPVHLQLLVVNALSLLDVALLSWIRSNGQDLNTVLDQCMSVQPAPAHALHPSPVM